MPLSFDPGEAYQFDWSHEYARLSGVTTKVKAAHMRLCYSRMQLVQIFPRESQEMVFEAHERAFRFFGGICRRGNRARACGISGQLGKAADLTTSPQAQPPQQKRSIHMVHKAVNSVCYRHAYQNAERS